MYRSGLAMKWRFLGKYFAENITLWYHEQKWKEIV
jgi:hypothetical protein